MAKKFQGIVFFSMPFLFVLTRSIYLHFFLKKMHAIILFFFPVDLKKGASPNATKSNLPKPFQSGLRPPGYSRLPPAKLATFGFVRSSSVSSISSKSSDRVQSDQSKTANRKSDNLIFHSRYICCRETKRNKEEYLIPCCVLAAYFCLLLNFMAYIMLDKYFLIINYLYRVFF